MKKLNIVLAAAALLMLAGGRARAQTYTFLVTSVTSSSTPVKIMPAATRNTWACKISGAAGDVDLWSYSTATTPVSKPTNYTVLSAASDSIGDSVLTPAWNSPPQSNSAPGQAWAAVLAGGSSAVTVYCWWR